MADTAIFLKSNSGLVLLRATAYDNEDVLQRALADYPQVIAGQVTEDEGTTRPLVLVAREISVPGTAFTLDHLFLDQDAVPVLVEVKRASDTRIRREVVGQMLDYASNASRNWTVSFLKEAIEAQARGANVSAEQHLAPVAGEDPERYWSQVEANLAAGRIRMLFVADELPDSLVRIIEFLNEQMTPAEVLGIEVRQFAAGEHVAYVPRVVGRTSDAVATKQKSRGTRWTRESFLAELDRGERTSTVSDLVRRLIEHVDDKGSKLSWGSGLAPGVGGWYDLDGRPTGCWALNLGDGTPGYRPVLVLYLGDMIQHTSAEHVSAVADRLEAIPSLKDKLSEARAANWKKWPSIPLADLAASEQNVDSLCAALDALAAPTSPRQSPLEPATPAPHPLESPQNPASQAQT